MSLPCLPRVAVLLCLGVVGPWSVCEAQPAWTPPLGIPAPGFGIDQTTDDNTFTHWVNNTVPCTDAGNTGTPANPRCTIPTTLAAGSIVQVRGGPYTIGTQTWTLNGTVSQPVYVRGPSAGPRPDLGNNANVAMVGAYAIVENLRMRRWTFGPGAGNHHLALRHCEVTDHPGTGGAVLLISSNAHIVIYDCEIARNGVIPSTIDRHGINMSGSGIDHVWIVDNHIHHNSGDAVQFCHECVGSTNDGPAHVYIGRNDMHHDEENAVNPKEFIGPVVVSQNRMWGYRFITSGAGEAIRMDDEGLQGEAWILFNDIWDSSIAINAQGSASTGIYVIGNEIHDIVTQSAMAIYPVPPDGGSAVMRVVNNTLVNVTDGILVGEARSNIIRATGTAIGSSSTGCSHNLVQQGTIPPSCTKRPLSGNPLLLMDGVHVVGLQPDSPAIDTGLHNPVAYATYQTQYGLDIRFDRAGVPRPAGGAWDRGAYEFAGTMVTEAAPETREALHAAHASLCRTIPSLPYTITEPGHYCLAQDSSTAITNGNAITIEADFVTLDLGGHRLSGDEAGPATQANGIYALNRKNITIANGGIRGYFQAVFLEDDSGTLTASEGHGIQNLRADGNIHAGIHVQGRGTVIRDNVIAMAGGSDVFGADAEAYGILTEGAGVRVRNNSVTDVVTPYTGGVDAGNNE
jgi:hypothetical protein